MPQPERGGDEGAFMLMVSTDSNPPFFPSHSEVKSSFKPHIVQYIYIGIQSFHLAFNNPWGFLIVSQYRFYFTWHLHWTYNSYS